MDKNIIDSAEIEMDYKIAVSPTTTSSLSFEEYQQATFYLPDSTCRNTFNSLRRDWPSIELSLMHWFTARGISRG